MVVDAVGAVEKTILPFVPEVPSELVIFAPPEEVKSEPATVRVPLTSIRTSLRLADERMAVVPFATE